jgi:hypothetical protein
VEQVTALRDPCDFQLALRNQSIEQCPQRGRAELVPEGPHVVLVAGVELAGADPTHRTLHRERLLLTGEVVDASVQDLRKLFPLVSWNVVERSHEAVTVRAGSDTIPPPARTERSHSKGPARRLKCCCPCNRRSDDATGSCASDEMPAGSQLASA